MKKTAELPELIGKHFLSGCDFGAVKKKEVDSDDYEQDCSIIRFVLDGNTYTATEDMNDGYRSMLDEITVNDDQLKNVFQSIQVVGIMKPDNEYSTNSIIQFYDVETGKLVLEVGTSNSNDYYPSFVNSFYPENMVINS